MISRICLLSLVAAVGFGESRFDRPVLKLTAPNQFKIVKQDDNSFAAIERNALAANCILYRGSDFYYLEVTVTNQRDANLTLPQDFVQLLKPGYTMMLANTQEVAEELLSRSFESFQRRPAPPPTSSTTNTTATATTYGKTTQVNSTSVTTVDNSAAWHSLGESIAQSSHRRGQATDRRLATLLRATAHETQQKVIRPGESRTFSFAYRQLKPKKGTIQVSIRIADETMQFEFKD
jgi:hypothetical protein